MKRGRAFAAALLLCPPALSTAADVAVVTVQGRTIMIGSTASALRTLEPHKPVHMEQAPDPEYPGDRHRQMMTYHYEIDGMRFALVYAVRDPGPASRIIRIVLP